MTGDPEDEPKPETAVERLYRNLPGDVGRSLIATQAPNEIVDSAEGGIRLPTLDKDELDGLIDQLTEASNDAADALLEDYKQAASKDGGPSHVVDPRGREAG